MVGLGKAGLTIVPIVPWHGAPTTGGPKLSECFAQMTGTKLQFHH